MNQDPTGRNSMGSKFNPTPEGHDTTIEVCNIMSFVLYTQILKQSVLKPASPGITIVILHRYK